MHSCREANDRLLHAHALKRGQGGLAPRNNMQASSKPAREETGSRKNKVKKEPEKIQGSRDAEENKTNKATETKVG